MPPRQAIVIASNTSRRGREAYETIPGMLIERGVEVIESHLELSHEGVCKRVKRAVKRNAQLVVVCGGDGTQTSAVPYLAHSDTVLGLIPAGTGNSFAYGLGLTDDFTHAVDAIAHGDETRVDLGTIDGTYFANFATFGLASEISGDTPHGLKQIVGPIAYGIRGLVPSLTHKAFRAKISWGKQRVDLETHQIIIANGRFYGHTPIAPNATLNDGRLTIFVRDSGNILNPLETYLAFVRGDQAKLTGVHIWSTDKELKITTKPKAPVAIDGRLFSKGKTKLGIAPKALKVMCPQNGPVEA